MEKWLISVEFLAASETSLMAFDILNKDAHKWLNADEDSKQDVRFVAPTTVRKDLTPKQERS